MKYFFLLIAAVLSLACAGLFADEFAQVAGPDISASSANCLTMDSSGPRPTRRR